MTDSEIIIKALDKAISNGSEKGRDDKILAMLIPTLPGYSEFTNHYYRSIVFSHDFAKAFWRENSVCGECGSEICREPINSKYSWQYHLSSMVLEPEPLKYLERCL